MFWRLFNKDVCKQITNSLNNEPDVDNVTKTTCKYRNLQSSKMCLSTAKQHHNLSIIDFHIISIFKNKCILEELLFELDNFPEIRTISKTKLNNSNINYATIQNYKLVFTNSSSNAGEVALYILYNLNYSLRLNLEFQLSDSENVFFEI